VENVSADNVFSPTEFHADIVRPKNRPDFIVRIRLGEHFKVMGRDGVAGEDEILNHRGFISSAEDDDGEEPEADEETSQTRPDPGQTPSDRLRGQPDLIDERVEDGKENEAKESFHGNFIIIVIFSLSLSNLLLFLLLLSILHHPDSEQFLRRNRSDGF